ncbi:MAG: AtpZ/AtpI family protein [Peptococcia bacterium]|jgi:F0F1-type ATP synthase assembly protein I
MGVKKNNVFKYLNYAISFGLTLVITVYVLYKGGIWLDQRLGTSPIFMILGVFLALVAIFWQLIEEIQGLEKQAKKSKPETEQEQQKRT